MRIELIDLPDDPDPADGRESAQRGEPGQPDLSPVPHRRVRPRLRLLAGLAAAAAALVVASQLVPGGPATRGVHAPATGAARNPVAHDPVARAPGTPVARDTSRPAADARPVGATSGDCHLAGLRAGYPDADRVAAGIRTALLAHIDPGHQHLGHAAAEVNCVLTGRSDRREVQSVLTWTAGGYRGVLIVNVADFDDPSMTGCGTGWSCVPTSTSNLAARSARLIHDNGDRGFGVVVHRRDGQYVSIQAGAAAITNDDIDPVRSLEHFPFDARALLKVALDPRVSVMR